MEKYILPLQREEKDRFKELIISYLENISVCYNQLFIMLQEMKFYNKISPTYFEKLQEYTSLIINLYKILKPKIRKLNIDFQYLNYINHYIDYILKNKDRLTIESTKTIFFIFNNIEDELRFACEELELVSNYK
jgi:hypothetical protein